MAKSREYFFFVEALDSFTNEAVARLAPDEDVMHCLRCADGVDHNLWRFTAKTRSEFRLIVKSQLVDERYRFVLWSQEGRGQIRRFPIKIARRLAGKSSNLDKANLFSGQKFEGGTDNGGK